MTFAQLAAALTDVQDSLQADGVLIWTPVAGGQARLLAGVPADLLPTEMAWLAHAPEPAAHAPNPAGQWQ